MAAETDVGVVPEAVAVELVTRYGAALVGLADAAVRVAERARPDEAAELRRAVRDARFELVAIEDVVIKWAARDA